MMKIKRRRKCKATLAGIKVRTQLPPMYYDPMTGKMDMALVEALIGIRAQRKK